MVKKFSILVLTLFVLYSKINGQPVYRVADHRADSAAFVLNIGKWNTCLNSGKFDSALYYAKKMISISQDEWGEVTIGTASTYFYVGLTYDDLNDFTSTYHFYKLSINRFEASNIININDNYSLNLYRITLLHFGVICNNLGAYSEAETAFSKCIPLTKTPALRDVGMNIQALVNSAITYSSLGEYYKARLLYDSAKQIIDTLTKNSWAYYMEMSTYNNIADIYSETGNPQKGLDYVKKAERVFNLTKIQNENEGRYFQDYITVKLNVADAYKTLHYTDSALQKCNEAEDSLSNKKDDFSKANILQEKASVYIDKKKFAKAMQLCKQSLIIMDTLPNRPGFYDATLLNLAALYQQKEEYTSADSFYRREINYLYAKGLTASYYLQQTLTALCQNLLYQNRNKEAADSLLKAGDLAMHVLTNNFAGMPEGDQIQYSAAFDGIFSMLNSLLAKDKIINKTAKQLAFALQLQRKNMVLANQEGLLSRLRQSNDTAMVNRYAAWLNMKQILTKQYSLPYSDRNLNTDSLEEISEELEKQASAMGYTAGISQKNIIAGHFLQQDKNIVNIEFVRYNYITKNTGTTEGAQYGAFILKGGDSTPAFVPLCNEAALIHILQNGSGQLQGEAQLTQKLYSSTAVEAMTLYTLIWKPLDNYLQGASVINYSPAGLLNNISFHALYNGKNWLANNYTMHCFSSLADVANTQTAAAPPKQISLWGNMDYDSSSYNINTAHNNAESETNSGAMYADGIKPAQQLKSISKSPLPNFYTDELAAIKKVFAANNISYTGYENAAATEDNFKQSAPKITGVLHISTHGFYTPYNKKDAEAQLPGSFIAGNTNPLFRCGLAFAGVNYYWMKGQPKPNHDDGILTGYEVSQLDLHNVQLVTLSACETGLGDITATEGNLGLQRAFKLAGVQKLLVSLWQVPAKQTQQLLTKFYTYWLAGGTPAQALQTAETDMQKAHYPPYYWAGFVLVE